MKARYWCMGLWCVIDSYKLEEIWCFHFKRFYLFVWDCHVWVGINLCYIAVSQRFVALYCTLSNLCNVYVIFQSHYFWSWNSSVGIGTRLWAGKEELRFSLQQEQEICLLSKLSRLALRLSQSPIQWVTGEFFCGVGVGVKLLRHEVKHSLPSSVKIKNEQSFTSIPPCVFMACTGMTLLDFAHGINRHTFERQDVVNLITMSVDCRGKYRPQWFTNNYVWCN